MRKYSLLLSFHIPSNKTYFSSKKYKNVQYFTKDIRPLRQFFKGNSHTIRFNGVVYFGMWRRVIWWTYINFYGEGAACVSSALQMDSAGYPETWISTYITIWLCVIAECILYNHHFEGLRSHQVTKNIET
jgi:hypothetical protein